MLRNYTIDYLRLLFAFGVICIHLSPSSLDAEKMTQYFSISAVPFFLITSLYLFQSGETGFHKIRISRILIPYVSWSIIYIIFRIIKHQVARTVFEYDIFAIAFLGGAAVQLYFLPLLLCCLLVCSSVNILFADQDQTIQNKLLALLSIVILICFSDLLKNSHYLGFSGDFLRKVIYYVLFSQSAVILLPHLTKFKKTVFFGSCIITFVLILLIIEKGSANIDFISVFISFFILIACLVKPKYQVNKITNLALSTTYGIYLCHHLFIEGLEFALNRLNVSYLPYSILTKLIFAFVITVVSIIFVLFIRRWKFLSFLLLGEVSPEFKLDIFKSGLKS
jgi:peptidoglycan/LPS O-acetylase OafA/YrhL